MNKSPLFNLNLKDVARGLIMTAATAVLTGLLQLLENNGALPTLHQVKHEAIAGIIAGLVYVIKALLTNSNDQLLKKEGV